MDRTVGQLKVLELLFGSFFIDIQINSVETAYENPLLVYGIITKTETRRFLFSFLRYLK